MKRLAVFARRCSPVARSARNTTGPRRQSPSAIAEPHSAARLSDSELATWWSAFGDPQLSDLVERRPRPEPRRRGRRGTHSRGAGAGSAPPAPGTSRKSPPKPRSPASGSAKMRSPSRPARSRPGRRVRAAGQRVHDLARRLRRKLGDRPVRPHPPRASRPPAPNRGRHLEPARRPGQRSPPRSRSTISSCAHCSSGSPMPRRSWQRQQRAERLVAARRPRRPGDRPGPRAAEIRTLDGRGGDSGPSRRMPGPEIHALGVLTGQTPEALLGAIVAARRRSPLRRSCPPACRRTSPPAARYPRRPSERWPPPPPTSALP